MTFPVKCDCGATLRVKDELREQTRLCPKCKSPLLLVHADENIDVPHVTDSTPLRDPRPTRRLKSTPIIVGTLSTLCGICVIVYFVSLPASTQHSASHDSNAFTARPEDDAPATLATAANEATVTPQANPDRKELATSRSFTGVKESVLLAAMNANIHPDAEYNHQFIHATTKDDDTPNRIAIYKDSNNELYVMLQGTPGDLTLIKLIMPIKEFLGEKDGQVTGEGAGAFGRCVQRMTAAADPSWAPDLYAWMNENMARGLVTPEGISTSKNHLLAHFSTFKTSEDEMMVSMVIGVPATSAAE